MVALCQKSSWLFDERAECSLGNHLIERWQIAELTDEEIQRMPIRELLQIINRSSQLGLSGALSSDGAQHDKPALRRLVFLARRTCRQQGY